MKSQEQIIGYILLGIVILGISIAAYNYIVPMIQKSNVRNIAILLEDSVKRLSETISSVGLKYSRSSFEFKAPESQIEILHNMIRIRLKGPIRYYSSYVQVPINYDEVFICYNNTFPIIVNKKYTLCFDESMLYIYFVNDSHIMLTDAISNRSVILPLGNYKNFITSLSVFDINYNGTHLIFISLYPTGVYRISSACIANAYQVSADITYEIVCRPLVDLTTKQCYWIRILPYQRSIATIRDEITVLASYNYYEDIVFNSTICDSVRLIDVYVSLLL